MKIKALLGSIIAICAMCFIACDDDMNTVGSDMRPDNDSIFLGVDSITLTARTISLKDSVYARSASGLLGEYTDDLYGKIEADYLCEFYAPGKNMFADKAFAIDSVRFRILTDNFVGDQSNLIGLTAFELNNPLDGNYFTNIDPKDYSDMSKPLAKGSFIFENAMINPSLDRPTIFDRVLTLKTDTVFGRRILDEWLDKSSTVLEDKDKFKQFFPGVYMTTSAGDGNLVSIAGIFFNIHYKYVGLNKAETADSIKTAVAMINSTEEVIQMHHIKNERPAGINLNDPDKSYLMTPAGLCTEITIPLKQIIDKMGKNRKLNLASFHLTGFTQEEEKSKLQRPSTLLFVNKDSIDNFFVNKRIEDNETSFIINRYQVPSQNGQLVDVDNTYRFTRNGSNINKMITHYVEKYKNEAVIPDLKYLVIPVNQVQYNKTGETTNIYNQMFPTSAILRTDPENMKMKFIFSEHVKN